MTDKKTKVLVLCHGNINRSPLCAAVLARHGELEVRQAGVKPNLRPGKASKKMRDAALELGLNLDDHRSQPLTTELFMWADYIVVMDGGNEKRLVEFAELHNLIGRFLRLGHYANPPSDRIPDPAFIKRGTPEFDDVVQLIYNSSQNLARKLIAGTV